MKFVALLFLIGSFSINAPKSKKNFPEQAFPTINDGLNFRCINGRSGSGGRSAAVAGVEGKPMLFYMGSTGGGVWKTQNGGSTWENISDGFFGGSIGSIEGCQIKTQA